jgi:predicted PurR-regulated permease PerM
MALYLILFIVFGLTGFVFATQGDVYVSGKEIIEKLAKLEEGQNGINRRIDNHGKRIDDLRSELKGDIGQLSHRIDDLRGLIYVILAGIIALIGFVIWDRRTALSPVIRKTKGLEEKDDRIVRALNLFYLCG